MSKPVFRGLVPLVVLAALLLRLPGLSLRPMHHDEANQAMKFGTLLETGEYRYDPADHHGPSLYYLTWILAKALGRTTTASLDETTLRLLPALFGTGTVVLLLLFAGAMGRAAALAAGLLAALSPAFTYYSRFYIQETIFVFFIAAFALALWKYRERPTAVRAAAAGVAAGLMFATKETSVIIFAAVGAAVLSTRGLKKEGDGASPAEGKPRPLRDLCLGAGLAAFTAAVLFSSFFQHPRGILDSVLAFGNYFAKSGDPGFHAHPVGYYIGLLTYSRNGGLVWSESLILALACLGTIAAVRKRGEFPAAAALASIFAAAAFSLLAYKTPWNVLPFHFGFIVLAGVGTEYLFRVLRKAPLKIVAGILLGAGLLHLAWQSGQANFRYPADPRNPYVYAQTIPDYQKLIKRVDDVSAVLPDRDKSLIKVVSGPYETWPLPWSLRRYAHVGYWPDAAAAGGFEDAAMVIASEEQAARIRPLIADKFHEEFYGLRPDVLLTLFIRNESWDRFLEGRGR
jgi:uncharacterized protein (TIGR03663 family)